ncbi:alpha/beta hydrolase family protein [Chondromyces crocatus]|uniref:Peptidase S9 prolyl oligopeptidase catalytic domain-containing protein n=1 Tax=Chondromyces crocatus TaxID=52 RepID=A0A0K1E8L5_CHOCO|nr:dienelactone hydrolase family protein [Chondromyces crocatus]AKT36923.1 uncharacterized protein CMC5_010440 [Chondromyces crocatus]
MALRAPSLVLLAGLLATPALVGCGDDASTDPEPTPETPHAVESAGPHPVGRHTFGVDDASRSRILRVELWYPAAESSRALAEAGHPLEDFATTGGEQEQLAALIAKAPDPGTTRIFHAASGALPASGDRFPLVAFSHCYNCTRYSIATVAERLASHGIAVVAPDHAGGTLLDDLAGNAAPLDADFLAVRAADIRYTLDRLLDAAPAELPVELQGRFDPDRVGVFGHSFGGITTGVVLAQDPRPRGGVAIAVPIDNPLLPGVSMSDIQKPLFFMVATEDNSITEIGNDFIRQNFQAAQKPAWKAEIKDAGHWSFTDICGIVESFDAGCSADVRQTDGEPFTYLDITQARAITAAYTSAFFLALLNDDEGARAYLGKGHPAAIVEMDVRE